MKKTILTIAVLMTASLFCYGQETTKSQSYTKDGKTFVQSPKQKTSEDDQVTAYKWRDTKGNEYPIILHTYRKGEKAGRTTAYVIRKSEKTGNEYHYYLPNGEQIAQEIIQESK